MPVFTNPIALWGLLSLLGLGAIYFFRRRSRDVRVSTLMFWSRVKVPSEGGLKLTSMQMPLMLLIEFLIILFFILAAASPRALTSENLAPLVIVVDNSFSMGVNEPQSPRARAIKYLQNQVLAPEVFRISLVKAGVYPEIIGRPDLQSREVMHWLEKWDCKSPDADLAGALTYVNELFPADTHVLILTDTPATSRPDSKTVWLSFGQAHNNLAITAANRYALGNIDRCFVEFTNFSKSPAPIAAKISIDNGSREKIAIEALNEEMQPGAVRRMRFNVRDINARLHIKIDAADADFDNEAWLLPVRKSPVPVSLDVESPELLSLLQKTIISTGLANIVQESAELVISDKSEEHVTGINSAWTLRLHSSSSPALIRGTATVDKIHSLAEGLPPIRAAWAVDPDFIGNGRPVISFENLHLLEYRGNPAAALRINLNFNFAYSNLQQTPVWPLLFHNILSWRQQFVPGPEAVNYRSGMDVNFSMPSGEQKLNISFPSGRLNSLNAWQGRASFAAEEIGLYQLNTDSGKWFVAVNLLSPTESDLRNKSVDLGSEIIDSIGRTAYFEDVRWWFLIPALLLLALHQWLILRRRPGYVF